jgi:hypothetical protein
VTPDLPQLEEAIHHLHGCHGRHLETVWVTETSERGRVRFEGGVHVFALDGHPTADSAYVWTDGPNDDQQKLFVVLRTDGVSTAKDAVAAALELERSQLN